MLLLAAYRAAREVIKLVSDKPLPDKFAPYASSKVMLHIITRFRDTGLPEPLTFEGLERIGVPSTMTSPAFRALRFLGLVDEGGNRLPEFERLRRASSSEYQDTIAEIIRRSYIEVFKIVDPEQDTYERVHDAFRGFDPANQRQKMVRLFLGLCEEAGIVPPQPKRHRTSRTPGKTQIDAKQTATPMSPPPPVASSSSPPTAAMQPRRYEVIDAIVAELPDEGKWRKARRDRWLAAMTSAVDLLIETDDVERME